MSGIYVASRVVHAPLWLDYRDRQGFRVISSWIDEAGEGQTKNFTELWDRVCAEIKRCRALVFYAQGVQDFPFKGALVEVGVALAFDKPVYVCLKDVMLEGRTMRPVGSWIAHRNVHRNATLDAAMYFAEVRA